MGDAIYRKKPGSLKFEAASDLDNNQLHQIGGYVGVVKKELGAGSGDMMVLDYLGVWELPKADAAGAIDQGDEVYVVEVSGDLQITDDDDDGNNPRVGLAHKDAAAGDSTIYVDLQGMLLPDDMPE